MKKQERQQIILQIIEGNCISTQEELSSRLLECGISATQATLSRDINELKLIKIPDGGVYRYSKPTRKKMSDIPERCAFMLRQTLVSVESSQNMVVLKTHAGMANAAAATIDGMKWNEVLGSIAGDDTIFVLLRDSDGAVGFAEKLNELMGYVND